MRGGERSKIESFFERLATPIQAGETATKEAGEVFSPFYLIGWVTIGTGALLAIETRRRLRRAQRGITRTAPKSVSGRGMPVW